MSDILGAGPDPDDPARYEIRVQGHPGPRDPMSSTGTLLFVPMALQEMVLAVWLIAKGFNPAVGAARAGWTEANELLSAA